VGETAACLKPLPSRVPPPPKHPPHHQIAWFKAGSALNAMAAQFAKAGGAKAGGGAGAAHKGGAREAAVV
jgi:hypothetical protein